MVRARAIFFDLGETLVTQNIEDNLVTMKALEKISEIIPHRNSPSELFTIYKQGYNVNEVFRTKHCVEIPIQAWMVQLLRRALGQEPEDSLWRKPLRSSSPSEPKTRFYS